MTIGVICRPHDYKISTTPNKVATKTTTFKVGDLVGCKDYNLIRRVFEPNIYMINDISNGIYSLNRKLKSGLWSSHGCKYLKYEASDLYKVDSNGKPIITNSTNSTTVKKPVTFINKTNNTVGLYWNSKNIDYMSINDINKLKLMKYLHPKESFSLKTCINHHFICSDFNDDTIIKVVEIKQNVNTVSIEN